MGSCKASGKVVKLGDRRKKRRDIIRQMIDMKLEKEGRMRKPKLRSKTKPNRHRLVPMKARGFHELSLQMRMQIPGIHKRYKVDGNGTITNLGEGE